ncbi:MAG: hypothetical protein NTX50_28695 [Candidatus Sumerlaeota bacterium]|nr:hypothetical protein [Candidatus Sumerlaeota bacterium]
MCAMLDRRDYDAAADLGERLLPKKMVWALRALGDLRRADFDGAAAHARVDGTGGIGGAGRVGQTGGVSVNPRLSEWIELLKSGRKAMKEKMIPIEQPGVRAVHAWLLEELELQVLRREYPQALATLYRLQESLLRIRFERIFGLTGEEIPRERREECNAWIEAMRLKLKEKESGKETSAAPEAPADAPKAQASAPGEPCIAPGSSDNAHGAPCIAPKAQASTPEPPNAPRMLPGNREFMSQAIQSQEPDHPLCQRMARLYHAKGQGGIMGLRNKSQVAHGFRPVTEKEIKHLGWSGGFQEVLESARTVAQSVLGNLPQPLAPEILAAIRAAIDQEL